MIKTINAEHVVKDNYIPYAMETIVNRAIPDIIDGCKPIHKKVLYQIYNNGWTSDKSYVKSGRIVGEVLKVHEHGDGAAYEAACLLTDKSNYLLYGLLDGHGNFGDISSNSGPAAYRYTHMRMSKFSEEVIFRGFNKELVGMYSDGEGEVPIFLPTLIPLVLIKNNTGIACTIGCDIPSFNLSEICRATIELNKNPNADLIGIIKAPDFSSRGNILYDENVIKSVIETGQGSWKVKANYEINKKERTISFTDLPYGITIQKIEADINSLRKKKSLAQKYILDVSNDTGYDEEKEDGIFRVSIDVRSGTNYEALVAELFAKTHLQTSIPACLRVLDNKKPKLYGIRHIILRWLDYRRDYVRKQIELNLSNNLKILEELKGIKILIDNLDKGLTVIRESKKKTVCENLKNTLGLNDIQVAKIKTIPLTNLNIDDLSDYLKNLEEIKAKTEMFRKILDSEDGVNQVINSQVGNIMAQFDKPRLTKLCTVEEFKNDYKKVQEIIEISEIKNVKHIITKEGYYKKVPLTSIKSTSKETLKDGDNVVLEIEGKSNDELLLFREGEVERVFINTEHKLSDLGEYINSIAIIPMIEGELLLTYSNGYTSRICISCFKTKNKKLKLREGLIDVKYLGKSKYIFYKMDNNKSLLASLDEFPIVGNRNAKGVKGVNLDNNKIIEVTLKDDITDYEREEFLQKRGGKGKRIC